MRGQQKRRSLIEVSDSCLRINQKLQDRELGVKSANNPVKGLVDNHWIVGRFNSELTKRLFQVDAQTTF